MIVYRKYLKPKLEFIKICKNYIWVKIKSLNSFDTLTGNANHLYFCACYIPPITSPYFNEEIFHDQNEDINNFSNSQSPLLLCGDLNSGTRNNPDFICNTKDGNSLTDQITTQIDTYRRNVDSEVNRNVDSEVNRNVDSEVNRNVDSEVNRNVDSEVNRNVDSEVNRNVDSEVNRNVDSEVNRNVDSEVNRNVDSEVNRNVDSEVNRNVDSEVNRNVDSEVNRNVDSEVNRNVDSEVNRNVDSEVNRNVDSQVNRNVDSEVNRNVDSEVNTNGQNLLELCKGNNLRMADVSEIHLGNTHFSLQITKKHHRLQYSVRSFFLKTSVLFLSNYFHI